MASIAKWLANPAAAASIGSEGTKLAIAPPTTACVLEIIAKHLRDFKSMPKRRRPKPLLLSVTCSGQQRSARCKLLTWPARQAIPHRRRIVVQYHFRGQTSATQPGAVRSNLN